MVKSKVFICYSVPLLLFLLQNNIKYEVIGLHPKTKKTFWVFIKNKELSRVLSLWNK